MLMEQSLRVQIVKEVECTVEALELNPRGGREPWEVFELWRSNVRCVRSLCGQDDSLEEGYGDL